MRYLIALMLLFGTASVKADDQKEKQAAAQELSEVMGIQSLIDGVMDQTRSAMISSTSQLSDNLRVEFPNMTEQQAAKLDSIFSNYSSAILDSIDTREAARIYTSIVFNGLSTAEAEAAIDFYQSDDGQNTMKVVADAAAQMNDYMLTQIQAAQSTALPNFMNEVRAFKSEMLAQQ